MLDGSNPLDFIKNNLANAQVVRTAPDPTQIPPEAPPATPPTEAQVKVDAPKETPKEILPKFGFEEEKKEEVKTEAPTDDLDTISEDPVKENYLKLRTKTKELKQSLESISAEKKTLEEKVKRYETGEVVPDILKEKEETITKLSQFEKLHNLKMSKEYTEKFVTPINSKVSKLRETFLEYGIPPEQIDEAVNHALNIPNKAQLNSFLSDLNFDSVGAEEIRSNVTSLRDLQREASEAEKEPGRILEHLQEESRKIESFKQQERISKISDNARSAWVENLMEIRNEGKILELIRNDSDPHFNETFVDPILTKSAEEYGRVVTELTRLGVSEVPKELAKGLSKMVQLAHVAATAIATRDAALAKINEMESTNDRVNNLLRPRVGSGTPTTGAKSPAPTSMTPQEAANILTNSILHKR